MPDSTLSVLKEGRLTVLNWNIGGAKYLGLKAGPPLFREEADIADAPALVSQLANATDPLCAYVRARAAGVTDFALLQTADEPGINEQVRAVLNELLRDSDLYEEDRFRHVKLRPDTSRLLGRTVSCSHGNGLIRLNRSLLEDAFSQIVRASETRDEFQERLRSAFAVLLSDDAPDIITLQEVVQYEPLGRRGQAQEVLPPPDGYHYFPHWLIDTERHSHQGKWNKVRQQGGWDEAAFFAQGNAILIRRDIPHFRIYDLPAVEVTEADLLKHNDNNARGSRHIEIVALESGIYFGDRNTEPRAAMVGHVVLSRLGEHGLCEPLDVFVINLHLTTLSMEREGIPDIDERAAQTRLQQLDIVLNGIVSRYNQWRRQGYRIRDLETGPRPGVESHARHKPIWVVAGDFNCIPESLEYTTLVRRGFVDLVQNKGTGTKAAGLGNEPTITLDYVFAGPRFESIDPHYAALHTKHNRVQVNQTTMVSDHFPLIAAVPIAVVEPVENRAT